MLFVGTKMCCAVIIIVYLLCFNLFHLLTFVVSYFMHFLLSSSSVPVIGLLVVVSAH
jgi:hypothetical protein